MKRPALALLFLGAAAIAGAGGCLGPDSIAPASRPQSAASSPVLGSLQSRDRVVSFRGGADGPRFTVQSRDGELIAADLTLDQVTALHPELGRALRGVATEGQDRRARDTPSGNRGGPVTDSEGRELLLAD